MSFEACAAATLADNEKGNAGLPGQEPPPGASLEGGRRLERLQRARTLVR